MDIVAKDSALTTNNTEAVGENVYTNLFINPYIGRVVNGFAIEEGTTFGKSTNLNMVIILLPEMQTIQKLAQLH